MPTLTRIIDLLCQKDLVIRVPFKNDRRKYEIRLTEQGEKKVNEMWEHVGEIRQKAWEGLTSTDFEQFQKVLDRIYENLTL